MTSRDVPRMQKSSQYAADPEREQAVPPRYINTENGAGSMSSSYNSRSSATNGGSGNTSSNMLNHSGQQHHHASDHVLPGASDAGGDHERPAPSRRPSGIALPTYQVLAHDPVYMAARTSPIGPPPRAALPALPPVPSGSGNLSSRGPPPPREGLSIQHGNSSGMLAMASESRPVTAVFNGDWAYPSSSTDGQPGHSINGNPEASTSTSQHRSQNSNGHITSQGRAHRGSPSTSKQRNQEASEDNLFDDASPSTSRHGRHATDASSSSSPPFSMGGPSSFDRASPGRHEQADGPTSKMASKTVLTIALMEAQKAVKLDQAEQAEAAIASYTKSVELLQEVMRRVSENAGTYRQKELDRLSRIKSERIERWKLWRLDQYRRAGVQVNVEEMQVNDEDIETREERRDREKREARIARRERMREEECAKLRLIHDTYAERVHALTEETQVQNGLNTIPAPLDQSRAVGHTEEVDAQRQLARLSIDEAIRSEQQGLVNSRGTPNRQQHGPGYAQEDSVARAGIGSAMLANSPLSPGFPSTSSTAPTSTSPQDRVLASAVPFPASPPSNQNNVRQSYTSVSSASPPTLALPEIHPFSFSPANSTSGASTSSHSQPRPSSPPMQQSILSFSPDSDKSDSTAFSEQQQQSPGSRTSRSHRKNASSSASYNKTLPTPEGYATFGDLAAQRSLRQPSPKPPNLPWHREQEENPGQEGLATPTPDTAFSKAFAPHPEETPTERKPQADPARSRANSRASNALRHMTSSESLASTTTSSSAGGNHWSGAAQKMPLPPMPDMPKDSSVPPPPAHESSGNRASIIGSSSRPLRSASLVAGQPVPGRPVQPSHLRNDAPALASESQRASALLINPSTLHGTISQRRKSPHIPDSATFPRSEEGEDSLGVPQSDHQGMTGLGLTRTSSTERGTANRASMLKSGSGGSISPNVNVGPAGSQPFNVAGSLPMRLRALSQPSKRPGMPSFNSESGQDAPPLPIQPLPAPSMQRADSDPSATASTANDGAPPTPHMPTTPMSFEYPGSLEDPIYNIPGISGPDDGSNDRMISPTSTYHGASSAKTGQSQGNSFLEPETPASMSFQHHTHTSGPNKGLQVEYVQPPSDVMRVPFHFMRQIRASILSGAYLTPRLYIPKQLWSQSSMKLIHTETKVRMLDLLLNGLEAIERSGDVLLMDGQIKAGNTGSKIDAANRLMRELESFESMLDGVQSTLAKKLPYIEQPNGKKGGGSFGAWSSKLSRSMDRMTKGKNLDAPETYVAAIARLCLHSQILDRHLASLHGETSSSQNSNNVRASQEYRFGGTGPANPTSIVPVSTSGTGSGSGYNDIPPDRRIYIETRLKRSSDFFSKVICKMLLNDLGIWLDKYSKRAAGWTTD